MTAEQELAELRQTVRQLKDRQDILDLLTREVRGRDRQDEELTASCYWPEGFDEHGPVITPGPDYPARANWGHGKFFAMTSHNLTNHSCEIDGDTAHCETYVVGGLLAKDGQTMKFGIGRYIDRVERRGGEWRILHRRCTIEMTMEGTAEWLHSPAIKGFLKGKWDRSDPSYLRPTTVGPDGERW